MAKGGKGGRPTKYTPDHAAEARRRCASGAVMRELAKSWEITERTLTDWRRDHPELQKAIADGRAEAKARREAGGLKARRREKVQDRRFERAEIVYVRA